MKIVSVEIGGEKFDALHHKNRLTMSTESAVIKDSVKIDGKVVKVESKHHDKRDNVFIIKLAEASPTKEKSDDKPIKRAD
tara:strand:+ start:253 stop:492 length:240 start_codon:yes stop_codon:yes gene_type:complete